MTTVAGGGRASASSEVAMVCCLGSRSRDRLMPNEDWRNQGREIFRRDLVLPFGSWDIGEPELPPPLAAPPGTGGGPPPRLGLGDVDAAGEAAAGDSSAEEDILVLLLFQVAMFKRASSGLSSCPLRRNLPARLSESRQ